jgi:hypothetical protein
MVRLFLTLFLVAAVAVSAHAQSQAQTQAKDPHLREPGSAVVLSHSAFAHGYRHGYEEGYHVGNTDISVGTVRRCKLKDIHGLKLGYSSLFGPRAVFEKGFQAGLKVGYRDGYSGHAFRAIDSLRALAVSLEEAQSPADTKFVYFDQGFFSGYNDGFEHGDPAKPTAAQIDFHFVSCSNFLPAKQPDLLAEKSYCDGYQRGFALGHADSFILGDAARLEASK